MRGGLVSLIVSIGLLACSSPDYTGNSAETGNPEISGVIIRDNAQVAANVQVLCVPSVFTPFDSTLKIVSDTTDLAGRFVCSDLTTGNYSVQVRDFLNQQAGLVYHVESTDSTFSTVIALSGDLELQIPEDWVELGVIVYLPGTDLNVKSIPGQKSVVLKGLPQTALEQIVMVPVQGEGGWVIQRQFQILPGDTVLLGNMSYPSGIQLDVAPKSFGVELGQVVEKFPLFIKLSSETFGTDSLWSNKNGFQVTDVDQNPIPFQISRIDTSLKEVDLWVYLNQLNPLNQSVWVFWGKNSDVANHAAFSLEAGFSGVWHLETEPDTLILDAGPYLFQSKCSSLVAEKGIIGNGFYFDGRSSFIEVQNSASGPLNFPENGTYSISLWARPDSSTTNRFLVGKGMYQYHVKAYEGNYSFWESQENPATGGDQVLSPISWEEWAHVVAVRNGDEHKLYINGTLAADSIDFDVGPELRDTTKNLQIGRRVDTLGIAGQVFLGVLDEVWVHHIARDSTWIRMVYENQKPGSLWARF